MMKNPLSNLMQQAQKMQENMKKAQAELADMRVTGESGGGMIKVVMSGRHQVQGITIDPSLVGDDADLLEDLLVAAFNDAVNKVSEATQDQMKEMTGGLNLPPGMQFPF
ncbi:MAG: nucleoid-associated protein [Lysobacteraceae bacterium]|nr:MAG: nucleoid-associated protein [Xanthomonadaceae bacterium]